LSSIRIRLGRRHAATGARALVITALLCVEDAFELINEALGIEHFGIEYLDDRHVRLPKIILAAILGMKARMRNGRRLI
jgi:hypothetical protein